MNGAGVVERACQLAREGRSGGEVRARLSGEGYSIAEIQMHLRGASIKSTLKRLAAAAARP